MQNACVCQHTCFPALQIGPQRRRYDPYVLAEVHHLIRPALLMQRAIQGRRLLLVIVMVNRTLSADEDADEDGEAFVERSSQELTRLA